MIGPCVFEEESVPHVYCLLGTSYRFPNATNSSNYSTMNIYNKFTSLKVLHIQHRVATPSNGWDTPPIKSQGHSIFLSLSVFHAWNLFSLSFFSSWYWLRLHIIPQRHSFLPCRSRGILVEVLPKLVCRFHIILLHLLSAQGQLSSPNTTSHRPT